MLFTQLICVTSLLLWSQATDTNNKNPITQKPSLMWKLKFQRSGKEGALIAYVLQGKAHFSFFLFFFIVVDFVIH